MAWDWIKNRVAAYVRFQWAWLAMVIPIPFRRLPEPVTKMPLPIQRSERSKLSRSSKSREAVAKIVLLAQNTRNAPLSTDRAPSLGPHWEKLVPGRFFGLLINQNSVNQRKWCGYKNFEMMYYTFFNIKVFVKDCWVELGFS